MQNARVISATAWFAAMAGWAAALSVAAAVPPEVRLLEEARTFKVEVEQKYDDDAGIELPFELVVTGLLEAGGLEQREEGDADVTVRIQARGTPLAQKYRDFAQDKEVEHFSGANLAGGIELVGSKGTVVRLKFSGRVAPPLNLHTPHPEPGDAPFLGAFADFVDTMVRLVAHGRGGAAMEKILAANGNTQREAVQIHNTAESFMLAERDRLVTEVPWVQTAAAVALAELAPSGVFETLRAALSNPPAARQAAALRGLLVLQRQQQALPPTLVQDLISMLDAGEGELAEMESDGRWSTIISPDTAAESAEAEDGSPEVRPEVLQALRALPATPEKQAALLAALEDKESVMRRVGAALLLGWDKDRKAVKPLITALEGDPHELVQAAAASALGLIRDKRAAVPLLKRALQAEEDAAKYAALNALELIAPEMVPRPKPEKTEEPAEENPPPKP